jgi:hypothetical protein
MGALFQDRLTDLPSAVTCFEFDFGLDFEFVGGDKKRSFRSQTVKYGRESHGTRTPRINALARPAAIVNDRPILSPERMLYKDYDRRCLIEEK